MTYYQILEVVQSSRYIGKLNSKHPVAARFILNTIDDKVNDYSLIEYIWLCYDICIRGINFE